jgi:hypothetical protein
MTYQPFQAEGRSKRRGLVRVDRRTREGRLLEQTRAALTAQLGGEPDYPTLNLIERACWLTLQLTKLNARIATGTDEPADAQRYMALGNALQRAYAALGFTPPPPRPSRRRTLAEALAEQAS